MSSQLKTLGKHTLIYGFGIVLGRAASFLMLPIYTRYLTPADYGTLSLLEMTTNVIGMIAGAGIASSVFKFHAEETEPAARRAVISTAATGAIALAALTAALGAWFSPEVTHFVFKGRLSDPTYFRMFFAIYFVQSVAIIPYLYLRALQKSVLFVALHFAQLVMALSLNIYFVVVLRLGVRGVLISSLITGTIMAVGLSAYVYRLAGVHVSRDRLRRMIQFGYPLVFWSLGSFVLTFSDRYFLNYFKDTAAVGLYALAYQFGFLLAAFASRPFNSVWDPQRYEIARQPDAKDVFREVFFYMNLVLLVMAFGIALLVKDVLRVMAAPVFLSAYRMVPIILIAYVLQGWTGYCNIGIYLKNQTRRTAWAAAAGVICALGLNILLIPKYGGFGAAWATVVAFAVRFALLYVHSQRLYYVDYGWGRIARLVAVLSIAYAIRAAVPVAALLPSIGVSLLAVVAGVGAVYFMVLTDRDRSFVRRTALRPLALIRARA